MRYSVRSPRIRLAVRYTCRRCGRISDEPYCERHAPAQVASKSGFSVTNHDRNKQKAFRAAVLARDGYACRMCGATDDLIAHHTTPVLDLPEAERYAIKHGICLCTRCHRAADPHAR
jgi:Fe2+ or Zn2+ uptake regulation protein